MWESQRVKSSCTACGESFNLEIRLPKMLPCKHVICLFCLTYNGTHCVTNSIREKQRIHLLLRVPRAVPGNALRRLALRARYHQYDPRNHHAHEPQVRAKLTTISSNKHNGRVSAPSSVAILLTFPIPEDKLLSIQPCSRNDELFRQPAHGGALVA